MATDYAANLRAVSERIARACEAARRDPASICLVAVSKNHPAEAIRALYDLGVRDFGESRLQEGLPKIDALPNDIVWHFIGKLQSNKAKRAAKSFDVIHTLESESQLSEIAKAERSVDGLIEVNLAGETQKSGVSTQDLSSFAEKVVQYSCVRFHGLMAVGPADWTPERLLPLYRGLAEANDRLGGEWLSLGMSEDLEVAIAAGSTHLRIGTALFGSRKQS